ncbi:MAG TPA: Ig-like domain-containing protein [Pyrinomonadaceae bacterium]
MFQEMEEARKTVVSLNETFAIVSLGGFAIQRAIEIIDPFFVALLFAVKENREKKDLPFGMSEKDVKTWLAASIGFLIGLALTFSTDMRLPEVGFEWGDWDKIILALALSAGANGLNSMLKFGEHVKEARKAEVRPLPTIRISPALPVVKQGSTIKLLASVSGTDIKDVRWEVLEANGGTIVPDDGTYTAPAQPGRFHVAAISQANEEAFATVTVTVK